METTTADVANADNIDHLWNDIEYRQLFSALPNSEPVSCIYSADVITNMIYDHALHCVYYLLLKLIYILRLKNRQIFSSGRF